MPLDPIFFLQNLGLTLLMGSLIGLERERSHEQKDLHEFGGFRTMALISILGYLSYSFFSSSLLFPITTGGFFLLVVASYVMSSIIGKNTGATTEVAAFFAYFIGVLMGMAQPLYATVITLLVVVLLYFKQSLHRFAHALAREELYDTLKFIAIVFVVLPLLPNQTFGLFNILNPYEIWLVVVLVSSISFVSYIAIKFLGPQKGIGLGGFLGGLTSSTAVAFSFSHLSRRSPKIRNPFIFGVILAASAMFFRVLFTVSLVNPVLLPYLYLPLCFMGAAGFLLAAYFWFKKDGSLKTISEKDLNLKSPFQFWPALQFGLVFAALLFISQIAADYFGDRGVYLTAFLSGIIDVDAITISLADLAEHQHISTLTAAVGICLAAMTNTLSKAAIVLLFGARAVAWRVGLAFVLMVGVGVATIFIFLPSYYGFIAI